jgi:hypothetical protein
LTSLTGINKVLKKIFEEAIFILAVIALTVLVVLSIDAIQATSDFATAPASALIAIVISFVLSMIRRWITNMTLRQGGGS